MTKIKLTFSITILLFLYSCSNKEKVIDENTYSIGVFYANNRFNAKDSANHFQHNCHFLLMLRVEQIEVYNRASENSDKKEFSVKFKLNKVEVEKFKNLVITESKRKKKKRNENHRFTYCGNSYVTSVENKDKSVFSISSFGLKERDEDFIFSFVRKERDEDFIFKLIEKSKKKKKIKISNKLMKEKYFMLGLIHQEHFINISEETILLNFPKENEN